MRSSASRGKTLISWLKFAPIFFVLFVSLGSAQPLRDDDLAADPDNQVGVEPSSGGVGDGPVDLNFNRPLAVGVGVSATAIAAGVLIGVGGGSAAGLAVTTTTISTSTTTSN